MSAAEGCGAGARRLWPLALLLFLGLGLRAARLTFQPLWWDEGYSVYFATLPLAEMVRQTAVDIHPPLYYALLHFWTALFGPGPVALRTFSVLAGLAAVPLAWALGKRLADHEAGWGAAALAVCSPFLIYYSQEVRMYALVTALGMGSALCHWELLRRLEGEEAPPPRLLWAGYTMLLTAALYAQYYAVLLLLAQATYTVLWAWRALGRGRAARDLLAAQGAALLLFAPWIAYAGPKLWLYVQYKVGRDADTPLSLLLYLARHLAAMGSGHWVGLLARGQGLGLVPVALAAGGLGRWARSEDRPSLAYLGLWLGVPLLGGWLINLAAPFAPIRGERLLLLAAPAFWLSLGWTLGRAFRVARPSFWGFALATAAIWTLCLGAFYTVPRYPNDDYRPLIARMAAVDAPEDAILCVFPWQVGYFRAYHPEPQPELVLTPSQIVPRAVQYWEEDRERRRRDLADLLSAHPRVWLPAYQASGSPLEGEMARDLESLGLWTLSEWTGTTNLLLYSRLPETWRPVPGPAQFGEIAVLEHGILGQSALESGRGAAAVVLTWRSLQAMPQGTRMLFRLRDEAGHLWAQWDREPSFGLDPFAGWPPGQAREVRVGLLLPAGLPPGTYDLGVGLVDGSSGEECPVRDATGQVREPLWSLGPLQVVAPSSPLRPEALPVAIRQASDLVPPGGTAASVRFLGYALPSGPVETGWPLEVTLFWQGLREVGRPAVVFLQGLDAAGQVRFAEEVQPARGRYPTDRWEKGTLCLDPHRLTVPADLPPGTYRLIAGFLDPATRERWRVGAGAGRGRDFLDLGTVQVRGRPHAFEPPAPQRLATALFGGAIRLVGYDLDASEARPGGTVRLSLHWQAVRTPPEGWVTFVHLVDATGHILAQDDGIPGGGTLPTTSWLPGEFVSERHVLSLPAEAAPGTYRLLVGWYRPETGTRVPVEGAGTVEGQAWVLAEVSLPGKRS